MKRIATIQDISCLGKCSLTVALPLISAMGVECCVVPTAVLSTHTMFSGFTFRDLTEDLEPIADHWEKEGFRFDAIYTGYLGSGKQLGIVEDYFRRFGEKALKLVDPVMGDNGKLYAGFTPEFAGEMARLCARADVILPNLTEAAFLLDRPYLGPGCYTEAEVLDTLKALCGLGAGTAVLTGVSFHPDEIGFMSLNGKTGETDAYFHRRVEASFHGTGDIFASVVTGGLMLGRSLGESLRIAADYTADCIRLTAEDPKGIRYGVYFEALIPELVRRITPRSPA